LDFCFSSQDWRTILSTHLRARRTIERQQLDGKEHGLGIREEAHQFRLRKNDETYRAGETAALFVLGRIDRETALSASGEDAKRVRVKLERLIERERLRGMRRHWSYDLNRHIALKQALDRIKASSTP
jgi:hypothetical protein